MATHLKPNLTPINQSHSKQYFKLRGLSHYKTLGCQLLIARTGLLGDGLARKSKFHTTLCLRESPIILSLQLSSYKKEK